MAPRNRVLVFPTAKVILKLHLNTTITTWTFCFRTRAFASLRSVLQLNDHFVKSLMIYMQNQRLSQTHVLLGSVKTNRNYIPGIIV